MLEFGAVESSFVTAGQYDVSSPPLRVPFVAAGPLEGRKRSERLLLAKAHAAAVEPFFSVNGCCDAARRGG